MLPPDASNHWLARGRPSIIRGSALLCREGTLGIERCWYREGDLGAAMEGTLGMARRRVRSKT